MSLRGDVARALTPLQASMRTAAAGMVMAVAIAACMGQVSELEAFELEEYDKLDYAGPWEEWRPKPLIYDEDSLPAYADMGYLPKAKADDSDRCIT